MLRTSKLLSVAAGTKLMHAHFIQTDKIQRRSP